MECSGSGPQERLAEGDALLTFHAAGPWRP